MFGIMFFRYPNLKTVREIIYKRGYCNTEGRRLPLTDNALIEKKLGKSLTENVVCIEYRFSLHAYPLI